MFAIVQNGNIVQIIQPDVAFIIGEKQYSARFIRNATEAERKAVGVYEVIEGEQKDQRFYWTSGPSYRVNEVDQTVEASYTATPKQLDDVTETPEGQTEPITTKGLKSQWIAQTKQAAGSMLSQTDWKIVRAAEGVKPVDADTLAARAAIRAYSDSLEAAITVCTTVEQLIEVLTSQDWPKE